MARSLLRAAAVVLLAVAAMAARAEATLTWEWTDIRCGIAGAGGSSVTQLCATPSFSALINPGESVYVSARLSYTYHDDGLALAQPVVLRPTPNNQIVIDHEAAVVSLISNLCYDFRSCSAQAADHVDYFSGTGSLLFFGNNLVADDLSGEMAFFASSGVPATYPFGPLQRDVTFGVGVASAYSGIAPAVPEPASGALLLAGMAMLYAARGAVGNFAGRSQCVMG